VADDEELERRALTMILERSGIVGLEVVGAANGREAIESAALHPPDLAILDLRMPGMDGIEAARLLRDRDPDLPVLFLTAFETFDYAREAARIGVEDYLVKPAGPEEVVAAVNAALFRSSERKARSERARQDALDAGRLSGFLEDELRTDLAQGRIEGARLAEYLELRRLGGHASFCAALRPSAALAARERLAADDALSRAAVRRVSELARSALVTAGWAVLDGRGVREAFVLAFGKTVATAARDVDELLSGVLARCRAELGIPVLAGASAPVCGARAGMVESARAALRAARLERPLVVLATPLEARGEARAEGSREPLVARALRMLDERRTDNLGLEEAAAELRVSPYHLSRVLKTRTGEGFAERLARLRVERVKGYLATGLYSVKEASVLSGFSDAAYCARVFRKLEGVSPTEYRDTAGGASDAARPQESTS
jgi:two-component system response regulator YesN